MACGAPIGAALTLPPISIPLATSAVAAANVKTNLCIYQLPIHILMIMKANSEEDDLFRAAAYLAFKISLRTVGVQ
jgi:hypothetical protein